MAEKRLRADTLRTLPEDELRAQLQTLRREIWDATMKAGRGALQQHHQLREARRQIARILTVLRGRHG